MVGCWSVPQSTDHAAVQEHTVDCHADKVVRWCDTFIWSEWRSTAAQIKSRNSGFTEVLFFKWRDKWVKYELKPKNIVFTNKTLLMSWSCGPQQAVCGAALEIIYTFSRLVDLPARRGAQIGDPSWYSIWCGRVEAQLPSCSCQVRWSGASGLGVSEEYHRHGKLLKLS